MLSKPRIVKPVRFTPKEQAFIFEYLVDLNATRAYERAYNVPHTDSVHRKAAKLMRIPRIKNAIGEALAARSERVQIDADFVLKRAAEMLNADIADIVDDRGAFKPVKEWPLIWRQTLSSCDIETRYEFDEDHNRVEVGRVLKLRFIDRLRTLELIGKHVNVRAFVDNSLGGSPGVPVQTIDLSRLPRERLLTMLNWLREADNAVIDQAQRPAQRLLADGT